MVDYGQQEQPAEVGAIGELPEGEAIDDDNDASGMLYDFLEQGNVVDKIPDPSKTAADAITLYDTAKESMGPWLKKYKRAINLAKLQAMSGDIEITEKTFPFEGASMVMMPYILEAVRAYATVGEMTQVLKDVFGEFREPVGL